MSKQPFNIDPKQTEALLRSKLEYLKELKKETTSEEVLKFLDKQILEIITDLV
jgi:hypothetical protein